MNENRKTTYIAFVRQCTRLVVLFIVLLSLPLAAFAQQEVKGVVLDNNKSPIPSVNVQIEGKGTATMTDIDGNFTIRATPTDVLIFTFVGFADQKITVGSRTQIDVAMKQDNQTLDEVVVIGYGTLKKSDVTGTIASVKPESLENRATSNAAEALQGLVSGVNIQKFGGTAGSDVYVKIRGVNTFGNNQPLYIIDGFQGSISSINPADIESMEVLKDGAAAAIYGSVAANGVIIVTTKSGQRDGIKVDFNGYLNVTKTAKRLELLDASEYVGMHKRMYNNYNEQYPLKPVTLPEYISNPGEYDTDWQDAIFRTGLAQNYSLGVTGGQNGIKFAIYGNYVKEKGIVIDNKFGQQNASAKVSFKKSIFDVDAKMAYTGTDSEQPNFQLKEAYMISPLVPIYDSSEPYGYGLTNKKGLPNNVNVVGDEFYKKSRTKGQDFTGNISVAANFTKWLQFKTAYSYRGKNSQYTEHYPKYIADAKSPHDYPYNADDRMYWDEQILDNILSFNKKFGQHSVNAMLGSTVDAITSNWNSLSVEGKTINHSVEDGSLVSVERPAGFLDGNFETIDAGRGGTYAAGGSKYKYNRASFFGRVNYSLMDRYLLQVTVRRDGSSKFDDNSRWATFPSVALGWKMEKEDFFPQNTFLSTLKLRASWGQLGNENALGYYDTHAVIKSGNALYLGYVQGNGANPWPGSIATKLQNRFLKWETTTSRNVGLDYTMFDGKVSGTLNYYNSSTNNLLIYKRLAPSGGLDDPILNVGKVNNSGFEFEINYRNQINKFQYNVGFNMSTLKNKVTELADSKQAISGEGLKFGTEHFPTQARVGNPINAFYLYRSNGIFQSIDEVNAHSKNGELIQPNAQAGDIRFKDINGNGVIDEDDKEYVGTALPKVEANLSLGAGFMGFDFSALIGSAWGHKLYNGNRYFYESMNSGTNMLTSSLDAWTPQNTNTDVPRAILQDPNSNSRESDRFLENGNFVRLRQIQLGYSLPASFLSKAKIEKVRVYFSCENLLTITGYKGVDPEFARTSVLDTGVDKFVYPFTKSFVFGFQFVF